MSLERRTSSTGSACRQGHVAFSVKPIKNRDFFGGVVRDVACGASRWCVLLFQGLCLCSCSRVCVWSKVCVGKRKRRQEGRQQEKKTDKARREQERESKTRNKMMIFLVLANYFRHVGAKLSFFKSSTYTDKKSCALRWKCWHFDRLTVLFPLVFQQDLFQLLLAIGRVTRQVKFKRNYRVSKVVPFSWSSSSRYHGGHQPNVFISCSVIFKAKNYRELVNKCKKRSPPGGIPSDLINRCAARGARPARVVMINLLLKAILSLCCV